MNNEVNLRLLRAIPLKGFAVVPPGPKGNPGRGRDVARQFAHMYRTRISWLRYNGEDIRALVHFDSRAGAPARPDLVRAFRSSGRAVEDFLGTRLREGRRVRLFKNSPARWLGYIIAHESHHRGSILLALKQNGIPLPNKVAISDVWYSWYYDDI